MKKLLIGAFLVLSTMAMGEMTKEQSAELDKLTKIFYPDNNMRADRNNFKKIQTLAYDRIIELKEESSMSEEAFDEIWGKTQRQFPGDYLQQEKEINRAFAGYKVADEIRTEEKKKEAEKKAALNEEAAEDILEIKSEEHLVPQEVMEKIVANAEAEYPNDHVAQREDIENKIKAYEDMLQYFDLNSPKK